MPQQAAGLRGVLRHHVSMADYCSWRAGGAARSFYEPVDLADLGLFLARLPPEEPLLFIGLGSNLLVRDGGFAGTVIQMRALPDVLAREGERGVHAGAGITLSKLARLCAREGLAGGEFLGGIPGTVGGALAMNAGAHGGETWPLVRAVETMDRQGVLRLRPAGDFQPAYRSVQRPADEWFVAAHFEFAPGDPAVLQGRLKELIARRNASQPTTQASCGSVFRNPPGDYAGRLIEQAGLKGRRSGGAQISDKHANFIVTERGATAADIECLIGAAQTAVSGRFGVALHPEAVIVGEAP
jgi:UDP-N-acetylmuramate dehydrogenase